MAANRVLAILELLTSVGGAAAGPADLVEVARTLLCVNGAGILLMPEGSPPVPLAATEPATELLHRVEGELGEGPASDAHRTQAAVLEPDLVAPANARWLSYAPAATAAGVRAVFAAPLHVGAARLGALSVWRDEPGGLSVDEHANLLVLADVATRLVLDLQASESTAVAELVDGDLLGFENVVHQASGMVSVQLGATLEVALLRLRAHAFTAGRSLSEVSHEIVDRRLRLDRET